MDAQKAVVVGVSGCSSSGKTTLARLLRDIFPNSFVLHEDDFYKPEDQLPINHGLVDWDCPEAISVPDMEKALSHIRASGTFPPFVDSKEDKNSVGQCPVSDGKISALKARVQTWQQPGSPGHALLSPEHSLRICFLDGFLLYCTEMEPASRLIDTKLFLTVSRAKATQRREARDGYVTLEGFWTDPPGYVDKIVWPNYAEAHAWMFKDGDAEGRLDGAALAAKEIRAQLGQGLDVDMETTLEWAVDVVMKDLERFIKGLSLAAKG